PPRLHRLRHVLGRRSHPEVDSGDEDRIRSGLVPQRRVEPFEEVRLHQRRVVDVEERAGIEDVRVDVRAGDDDAVTFDHHAGTFCAVVISAGSTISPAIAAAVATYAFARWTPASPEPLRPLTFRFV